MVSDDPVMEGLYTLDRDGLMERMAAGLPEISGELGLTPEGVAFRTGLDKERVKLIASGKRKMKWSEYMSILFFLWDDEKGREVVEERGLFPEALKRAMTVNRNKHE
ncbi:MAG: hypothetical protein IJ073_01215 [Lachnospiraceae bacterium]|nr:hypothetical protein [Lachnospiraceae bacterium]